MFGYEDPTNNRSVIYLTSALKDTIFFEQREILDSKVSTTLLGTTQLAIDNTHPTGCIDRNGYVWLVMGRLKIVGPTSYWEVVVYVSDVPYPDVTTTWSSFVLIPKNLNTDEYVPRPCIVPLNAPASSVVIFVNWRDFAAPAGYLHYTEVRECSWDGTSFSIDYTYSRSETKTITDRSSATDSSNRVHYVDGTGCYMTYTIGGGGFSNRTSLGVGIYYPNVSIDKFSSPEKVYAFYEGAYYRWSYVDTISFSDPVYIMPGSYISSPYEFVDGELQCGAAQVYKSDSTYYTKVRHFTTYEVPVVVAKGYSDGLVCVRA